MKRIIILTIVMVFALSSFALATTGTIAGTAPNLGNFTTSTNVTLAYNAGDSSFAAAAKHLNGNRCYGVASNSAGTYYNDSAVAVGTAIGTGQASASDSSAFTGSGWSSM